MSLRGREIAGQVTLGAARAVPRMYDRVSELCTSALGIIAALAWHSAVQELLDQSDLPHNSKLYYAMAVTGLAGLVALVLNEGGTLLRYVESGMEGGVAGHTGAPVVGGDVVLEAELVRLRS